MKLRFRHFRRTTSSQTEWVVGKILTVHNEHSTTTGKTYFSISPTTRLGEEGIGISFPNLMRKQSISVPKKVANIQENARRNCRKSTHVSFFKVSSLFLMLRCSPSVESVGSGGLSTTEIHVKMIIIPSTSQACSLETARSCKGKILIWS